MVLETSSICGTILDLLGGGRRLQLRCGTDRIMSDEEARKITFGIKKSGANIVRIMSPADGCFRIELVKQNSRADYVKTGTLYKVTKSTECSSEGLAAAFTRITGMELTA